MTTNKEYIEIHNTIYKKKNYKKAIEALNSSKVLKQTNYQRLLAEALFYAGNFPESAIIFNNLKMNYHLGLCYLFLGDYKTAQSIWKETTASPAQNWSLFFCELLTNNIKTPPSFLQIRTFLERDLNLFLKFKKTLYIQTIIDYSEILADINPETNKIIAKTFLYNNYPNYAKEYFVRAFDFTTQDAELYYLCGIYNEMINDIPEAQKCLKQAILLNDNYVPAKLLLEKLNR